MAASGYPQVMAELKEMRTDIHKLDTKIEVHISQDIQRCKDIDRLNKEVFNGSGLKDRISTLEHNVETDDKMEEKRDKFQLDIKSSLIVGSLMLLASTAAQWLVAKVF